MLESRRPGIRFEAIEPPIASTLPRMDIAAFVGFAASGPLDIPVVVEDAARFTEIFGDDAILAWDDVTGSPSRTRLGAAVRAFFAQGGRRCWVVRVARRVADVERDGRTDIPAADTGRFLLAGVLQQDGDGQFAASVMRARSPGSWSDSITAQVMTTRRPVVARMMESITRVSGVTPGDLLHLRFEGSSAEAYAVAPATPRGALHVAEVELPLQSARWFRAVTPGELQTALAATALTTAHTADGEVSIADVTWRVADAGWHAQLHRTDARRIASGAFIVVETAVRPADAGALILLVDSRAGTDGGDDAMALAEVGGVQAWWSMDALAMTSAHVTREVRADVLTLSVETRDASGARRRLDDLAFASAHARWWALRPDDAARFSREPDAAVMGEAQLFPLAGPGLMGDTRALLSLPLGVPNLPRDDFAQSATHADADALSRDGLSAMDASLFIDPALAASTEATLLSEAFRLEHQEAMPRRARGIHALLHVAEVSLVSVPDAAHRGWGLDVSDVQAAARTRLRLRRDAEGTPIGLDWDAVTGASGYRLERSPDPRFRTGVTAERVATAEPVRLPDAATCPHTIFWRVRALGVQGGGPWSNTVRDRRPRESFVVCGVQPLRAPAMRRPQTSGQKVRLRWAGRPATANDRFVLETSPDPTFVDSRVLYEGALSTFDAWRVNEGATFYRVAATLDGVQSPWSRTVRVAAGSRSQWRTRSRPPVDDDVAPPEEASLVEVQVALLRLCAARGDIFALLHAPEDYRARAVSAFHGQLASALAAGDPDRTLGFGALYHPWPLLRDGAVPPDGAVAGTMAVTSLAKGAWAAAANMPLVDALSVTPDIGSPGYARLNVLTRSARGVSCDSEMTLSAAADWEAIHVRRLISLLRRLALREGETYAFLPNDEPLRRLVRRRFEELLGRLFARGAFAGRTHGEAYQVVVDRTLNTPQRMERGELLVELRVAPSQPLMFLTVRLVQAGGALMFEER